MNKIVPHDRLMEEAELVTRQILRSSQRAVLAQEQILGHSPARGASNSTIATMR